MIGTGFELGIGLIFACLFIPFVLYFIVVIPYVLVSTLYHLPAEIRKTTHESKPGTPLMEEPIAVRIIAITYAVFAITLGVGSILIALGTIIFH